MPSPTIDLQQLQTAIHGFRTVDATNGSLWDALLQSLHANEHDLRQTLQRWHGIAVIPDDLWAQTTPLPDAPRDNTPHAPIAVRASGQLLLLTDNPWSASAIQALTRWSHRDAQLALARPGQVSALLAAAPTSAAVSNPVDSAAPAESGSQVVEFVEQAIAQAHHQGASDIHFETNRQGIAIKYRLDGVMVAGPALNQPHLSEEVISRIKVLAKLDITERRRPQDGRIHWTGTGGVAVDLRVSIMPSIFGEDAVLRLLDKAQLRQTSDAMSLETIGFTPRLVESLRGLARRPHGMLLVTGPTGSGKTTTVYAALSEINDGLEKIITIEDPVEYELPGVLQIPVNEQKGLTFATGLRSILRHDPDKILVGEIRDAETAEIAIQSALTGHLVFTTVHANSVFDVLGRFQHFGIDPFALASALNGIVVQRLLRRLCPSCHNWRASEPAERARLQALGFSDFDRLPVACGCEHCRQTGYRGRFVSAEVHELSDDMRDLIANKTSMAELRNAIYRSPEDRLLAQALQYVRSGTTSIEEVSRVVGLA